MAKKRSSPHIISYRRPFRINVGLLAFLVILVYVLISLFTYLTSNRTEVYEVRTGVLTDNLVYQAEKAIKDMGDKADAAQVDKVKAAIDKVKEALKGGDNETIKKATEELQKPLYEMSAAAYQQAQQAAGAAGGAADAGAQQQAAQEEPKKADDNVVDAEYTEVKDK